MIVDSSALIAILAREPEAEALLRAMSQASHLRISVANHLEVMMVLVGRQMRIETQESIYSRFGVRLQAVTLDQGQLAIEAFRSYGKGRHPARLNYGDCFAYALAKDKSQPLLFKGDDFSKTDIQCVEY